LSQWKRSGGHGTVYIHEKRAGGADEILGLNFGGEMEELYIGDVFVVLVCEGDDVAVCVISHYFDPVSINN